MSTIASLFTGANFKGTIRKYCDEIGWKIAEIDKDHAVLTFEMESGRTQTLYIIRFESTLEFSVPSAAAFNSEDDIPDEVSTLLLQRNAERKLGFWCIERLRSKYAYTVMHNVEQELIHTRYFAAVVSALIEECDEFENVLARISS